MRDEGRSLGPGLQDRGPNRRQLLRPNGQGGERVRKRRDETRQVSAGKTNESEPLMTCRKRRDAIETGLQLLVRDEAQGEPVDCLSDGRHGGGVSPAQALVRNVGTCCPDVKGDLQVVDP
jgi:hypothetical protein